MKGAHLGGEGKIAEMGGGYFGDMKPVNFAGIASMVAWPATRAASARSSW
jgi:hypothetical protein